MDKFFNNIDKQIEFNKGKNIFRDNKDLKLIFIDDTLKAISNLGEISADYERLLIDYATDKSLEEFCRINQYYTFNSHAKNELRIIYCDLFSGIKSRKTTLESISKNHYDNLKEWLRRTNPFAEKIYANDQLDITPVACAEYSAELQMEILKIDVKTLMEPVLDVGCGKHGNLVKHLCNAGIETSGIDRFSFSESNLKNFDWLEYNYGTEKWGTIVSNLGFSNHFKHHNLREDGNYLEYGKKYMDILKSLQIGGKFHYAPDLPFIEFYLDSSEYQINKYAIDGYDFKTAVITRLNSEKQ